MGKQTRFGNVSNVFSDCMAVSEPRTRACRARSQMNYFTSQDTCRYFESDYGTGEKRRVGGHESYNYSRLKDDADILGRGLPRKLSSTARQQSRGGERGRESLCSRASRSNCLTDRQSVLFE